MKDIELETLSPKDQTSLFKVNLFYYAVFVVLLFLNWYVCNADTHSLNSTIKSFKSGKELTCTNTFVSKTRGWGIDESNMRFIKADRFIDVKKCKGEDNHE